MPRANVTLRRIWHSRSASGAIVLTLALAIGMNAVTFSFVRRILLDGLPYKDADRIARVTVRSATGSASPLTSREFADWRQSTEAFERIGAFRSSLCTLTGLGEPLRLRAADVSSEIFAVLDVSPAVGRVFGDAADGEAPDGRILISHVLWTSHLGSADVVGRTIEVDGTPVVIAGIMPPGFFFPDADTGIWRPLDRDRPVRTAEGRTVAVVSFVDVIGRLRPAGTLPHAAAEGDAILQKHRSLVQRPQRMEARTLQEQMVAPVRPALLLLQAAGLLLLAAVVMNITNLFLVRFDVRRQENAVRLALGASRARLILDALLEAGILGAGGGLAGVALAGLALPAIRALAPGQTPRLGDVNVDLIVLGTSLAAGCLVCIGSGLIACGGRRRDTVFTDRAPDDHLRLVNLRNALTVVQVSTALVLGIGATLVSVSVAKLFNVPLGYDPSAVLSLQASLVQRPGQDDAAPQRFWQMALNDIRGLHGVQSAALASSLPLTGAHVQMEIGVDGQSPEYRMHSVQLVSADYFRTLRIPLRSGRMFEAQDAPGTQAVAIVSAQLAERLYGTAAVVGKRMRMAGQAWSIVGVVADVRHRGPLSPAEAVAYVPLRQAEYFTARTARSLLSTVGVVVRTTVEPAAVIPLVRRAVRNLDSSVPVYDMMSLSARLGVRLRQATLEATLFVGFAGVTLIVALVGVYGLLSCVLQSKTREIGVRVALGATPRQAMAWIGGYAGRLTAAGLFLGAPVSVGLTATIRHAIPTTDPLSGAILGSCVLVLVLAVGLATCGPASRASRIDPARLLREPQ